MTIICNRNILSEAVNNVSRAVPSKASFSALECILVETEDNEITFSGYNLEFGIKTTITADVRGEGTMLISAHLFSEIIKKLPTDEVIIECDEEKNITIRSGEAEFNIMGANPEDFPELPSCIGDDSLEIQQPVLRSMIRQTKFAVAIDDSKPVHKGILFETENGTLRLVAVDGYRLALRQEKIDFEGNLKFVVPGKTLAEIEKLLSEDDSEKKVEIKISPKQIFFVIDKYEVISRLLEGNFLDYRSAIPEQSKTEVAIDTRPLIECFERAALIIVERLKSPVRCIFADDMIRVSCSTPLGKSFEQFEAEFTGDPIEIGFNNRFLLDALRASESDRVRLALSTANSPMKILPVEGDSFIFLILPVRIKKEL